MTDQAITVRIPIVGVSESDWRSAGQLPALSIGGNRHARNNFPTAASIAEPCVDDAYCSRLLPAIFIQSDQSITIGGGCNVVRHLCREPFQIAGLERLASAVMGGYSVGDLLFAHGFGANRRPVKELRVPKACDNVPDRCPHKLPVSLFSVDEAGSGEAGVVCGSDWTLV